MEFRKYLLATILTLLYGSVMIAFAIGMFNEYGRDTSDFQSVQLNVSGMNRTLERAQEQAEAWKDAFSSGDPIDIGEAVISGFLNIGILMWNFATYPVVLLTHILIDTLNFPPIVSGVISFIFIISILFALYKFWKTGT